MTVSRCAFHVEFGAQLASGLPEEDARERARSLIFGSYSAGAVDPNCPDCAAELAGDQGVPVLEPAGYTVGEKIAAVLERVQSLADRPGADPQTARLVGSVRWIARLPGIRKVIAGLLPPLSDEEDWHGLLATVAGVAAALVSDGHELDLAAARAQGQEALARLFAEDEGRAA